MIHILNRKRALGGGGGGSSWNDLSGLTLSYTLDVSTDSLNPRGIFFKPDGTKMYIMATAAGVDQWTLSTPWDLSTATYDSVTYASGVGFSYSGIKFKPDGTELYMSMYQQEKVYQATLSTPWDLSTASATSNTVIEVEATSDSIRDIDLSSDGTKLFCLWTNDETIREYPLSTPWDISTVGSRTTSVSPTFDASSKLTGIYFDPNAGERLILLSQSINPVDEGLYQYDLTNGYDLTTMNTTPSSSFVVGDTAPHGVYVKADGTKLYYGGQTGDNIYEYDL